MTQSSPSPKLLPLDPRGTYIADLEAQITAFVIHRRERTRKTVGCAVVWAVAMVLAVASGARVEGERGYTAFTLFVYLL